jgi:hypothetical protein
VSEWPLIFLTNHTPLDQPVPGSSPGAPTKAESDFVFEKTRGRRPNNFCQRLDFNSALQRVALEDATVHRIVSEVTHLVRPSSALRDPQIVDRVTALMNRPSDVRD